MKLICRFVEPILQVDVTLRHCLFTITTYSRREKCFPAEDIRLSCCILIFVQVGVITQQDLVAHGRVVTSSRQITEVKQRRARLVLGWVTGGVLESRCWPCVEVLGKPFISCRLCPPSSDGYLVERTMENCEWQ